MKKTIKILLVGIVLLAAIALIPADKVAKAASWTFTGWAWSDNIGWIQFNPTFGGVFIDSNTGDFSGYAWSDNIGWIDFAPSGATPDGGAGGANLNIVSGVVTGWIRAIAGADYNDGWDGWISMSGVATDGSPYSVSMDTTTGDFSGWAWGSDVVGWISFYAGGGEIAGSGGGGTGGSSQCRECVGLPPDPDLFVALSAIPDTGDAPLNSTLTADVTGTATGDITYKFDCDSDGIYEEPGLISSNTSESFICSYPVANSYTATAEVERAGLTALMTVGVTVLPPAPPPTTYDLRSSGYLFLKTVEGSGPKNSNGTVTISVSPLNFTDDIILSSNTSVVVPGGATGAFFPTTLVYDPVSNTYNSSIFTVRGIQDNTPSKTYNITVTGKSSLSDKTTTVQLRVNSVAPSLREF